MSNMICPAAESRDAGGDSQATVFTPKSRLRNVVLCTLGLTAVGCMYVRAVLGQGLGIQADRTLGENMRALSAPSVLHDLPRGNSAFILIKPHAATDAVLRLINQRLRAEHVYILRRGKIVDVESIPDRLMGISGLMAHALQGDPGLTIPITEEGRAAFLAAFGKTWDDALVEDDIKGAQEAISDGSFTPRSLYKEWESLTFGTSLVKLVSDVYVGKINGVYIINGFYPAWQNTFTDPGPALRWMEVRWKTSRLSYANFTSHVIGGVEDSAAADGRSLRNQIYEKWEVLGLETQPESLHNSLFASDSPYTQWLQILPITDQNPGFHPFADPLSRRGIVNKAYFSDLKVFLYNKKEGTLRDHVAGLDRKECLQTLTAILKLDGPPP